MQQLLKLIDNTLLIVDASRSEFDLRKAKI